MCPLSSHPRPLCIKSCFSWKDFSSQPQTMFPHTSCRLCHPPPPSTHPPPSTSVSKAGSLAVGPACEFVRFRVQVGGGIDGVCLPVPPVKWSIFDRCGEGRKKRARKPQREGRANEQMSGLAGGCSGRSRGKCFLLGVSPGEGEWGMLIKTTH